MISSAASTFARRVGSSTTVNNVSRVATPAIGSVRNLNVHEYISMEIMNEHGIATPKNFVATTAKEADEIYAKMTAAGSRDVVIKAQVLSGGRGLGTFKNGFKGGVHMVTKKGQAGYMASQMLGQELVTKQAPNGIICQKVLLMDRMYARNEMYLSILMDRAAGGPLLVGSPKGGTSIEDVAKTNPELIFTEAVDINVGLTPDAAKRMATNIGLEEGTDSHAKAVTLITNLYAMFLKCDCTQVEVNPLTETPEGDVVVCDAKVNFDDNAAFRQKAIFERRDFSQEDSREVEAAKYDLNYIGLDGNIGCMVNGAGLAMSTMDIINIKGGKPANFLDVGGGANENQIKKAFEILDADDAVEAILVNIFGGIMKCDIIANGVCKAASEIGLKKPIVIRLQGTNSEIAGKIIEDSPFKMILAKDLEDAAIKAVGVAEIVKQANKMNVKLTFESL